MNIISLADMVKLYRVTFDLAQERALIVYLPHRIVSFHQMKSGLYGMNLQHKVKRIEVTERTLLMNTVEENITFLTPRQQEQAKVSHKTLEVLGTPSIQDLKAMIQMNLIRNNKVTTKDVNLAEQAFGPD
eukprot:1384294-Ditylum_brightwellii.AAC.1